jgi:hypothetical protein
MMGLAYDDYLQKMSRISQKGPVILGQLVAWFKLQHGTINFMSYT